LPLYILSSQKVKISDLRYWVRIPNESQGIVLSVPVVECGGNGSIYGIKPDGRCFHHGIA
jgi:hypothetical protein